MTTAAALLAASLLAQIVWTFAAMLRAGSARFAAARAGLVDLERAALHTAAWPDDVLKRVNNMNNQFETPTLFYALVLLALVLRIETLALAVLAWVYVASRVGHGLVQTGSNAIMARFRVFFLGVLCLMVMTAMIAIDLLRAALVS